MALVSMSKLTFIGLQKEKDTLYDVLISSQSVQLSPVAHIDACTTVADSGRLERLLIDSDSISSAISHITQTVDKYNEVHKKDDGFTKYVVPTTTMARPLVEMSYQQLSGTADSMTEIMDMVSSVEQLRAQISNSTARISQIDSEIERLQLYKTLSHPITSYTDTDTTRVILGVIASTNIASLQALVTSDSLAELDILATSGSETLVLLVAHNSEQQLLADAQSVGLSRSSINLDILPKLRLQDLESQRRALTKDIDHCNKQICKQAQNVPTLRTASDYLSVQIAKATADNSAPKTACTFVLEGYVPTDKVAGIEGTIASSGIDVAIYTEDIPADESAPIMYHNNRVVRNFEGITNMYSAPAYTEIDPNPVMALFYFLIFGFMVADIGYGLVLAIIGLVAKYCIKQETGMKTLLVLFGMCGVSAIAFGALYGSVFGFVGLYDAPLPDPSIEPMVTMVLALLFGSVHIMVGFLMRMAKNIKYKQYVLAFGVSLMWALFFAFAFMAVLEIALDYTEYAPFVAVDVPDIVAQIGLYGLIVSLTVALCCAGGGGKLGIGKRVTAGFGGAYSLLGLFSDVVSYIRIFALMLSSAMMGAVINDLSISMMSSGIGGMIGAVVLLLVGHLFNLVVGLLSIYIHCGRLQYVEFFGKFYQGEGEMFVPFGSDIKYTLIK